jgi:two-component system chemotaxis response regulator CheB
VDALFRTAARSHGPRVIGVVLTGGLDDGTVGLTHIKNEGGLAVAQEPSEAVFPSMPQSAIDNVEVDHVAPVAEIPALLVRLTSEPLSQGALAMANRREQQTDSAEVGTANLLDKHSHGPPTAITCPECGGALWERKDGRVFRYQCHVGHSYTAEALVAQKSDELESVLWTALRALEENADLRRRMARRAAKGPPAVQQLGQEYEKDANEAEKRAAVLREVLTNGRAVQKMLKVSGSEQKAKKAASKSLKEAVKSDRKASGRGNGRD